jgi:hypothetical protein
MNYDTLSHMRHSRFGTVTVTMNVWFRLTSPMHTMPYSLLVQETTWDVQISPQPVDSSGTVLTFRANMLYAHVC